MDNEKQEMNEKEENLEEKNNKKEEELSEHVETDKEIKEDEKGFFRSFGNWMLVLGTIFMTGLLIFIIVLGVKLYKSNFSQPDNTTLSSNVEIENETKELSNDDLKTRLDNVHAMANTVIVAKDNLKFGKKEVKLDNIEEALEDFKGVDGTIVEYLEKWKSGDFSSSVEFHNYVWKKLNGTIGEAGSLDNTKIEEAKVRLGF